MNINDVYKKELAAHPTDSPQALEKDVLRAYGDARKEFGNRWMYWSFEAMAGSAIMFMIGGARVVPHIMGLAAFGVGEGLRWVPEYMRRFDEARQLHDGHPVPEARPSRFAARTEKIFEQHYVPA